MREIKNAIAAAECYERAAVNVGAQKLARNMCEGAGWVERLHRYWPESAIDTVEACGRSATLGGHRNLSLRSHAAHSASITQTYFM